MLFLFSIFYYEEFTNITWDEKMNHTNHLPGFVLCYAPWCHHCKHALPTFKLFSDKYKNDSRIFIGTINCMNYSKLCNDLKVDGFPTYINSYLNSTEEIWLNHDNPSYEKNTQRLIDLSENKYFDQKYAQLEKFPHFEFTFQKDNQTLVNSASEAISTSDIYLDPSYSMKYGDNNSLIAKLGQNIEVTMDSEFTTDNIRKFLNEFQHSYYGDWSFRTIRRIQRRFVIIVDDYDGKDDQNNLQKYKSYFTQYGEKFAWGNPNSIKREKFNSIFNLTKSDYPAAIVIIPHPRRPKFVKISNLNNEQQIEHVLNEKYDNLELHNFNESAPFDKSFRTTMIIAACFIVFLALLLIAGVLLYLKFSNNEQNNPKID